MSSALETILSIHTCSSPVHWTWNPDKIWQTRLYFRVQSVWRRIQSHHWPWTHQCTGHLWWRWWFLGPGHKSLKTKITCAVLYLHPTSIFPAWNSPEKTDPQLVVRVPCHGWKFEGLCQTMSSHAVVIRPCRSFRRTATGPGRHLPAMGESQGCQESQQLPELPVTIFCHSSTLSGHSKVPSPW